jgi:hypothetical protein
MLPTALDMLPNRVFDRWVTCGRSADGGETGKKYGLKSCSPQSSLGPAFTHSLWFGANAMADSQEATSWPESRRLIISKLSGLETDLRDYGQKVELVLDAMRERHSEATEKMSSKMAEMSVAIALAEVKLKIWSAVIGSVASGAVALIAHFMTRLWVG